MDHFSQKMHFQVQRSNTILIKAHFGTNLPDARKYANCPVKHQNDKGVKFNTFDSSHKKGRPGQNCHF